ncbi:MULTISPECIES: hypothetical protein [unclassified Microcoleus]|uniref:hypothetical protein n=1 Tax=unclassified Microcoleus TaxID=2642155 RepID=UPI002FD2D946
MKHTHQDGVQPNKFFHSQSYPFPPFQCDDYTDSDRPSRTKGDRPSRIKSDRIQSMQELHYDWSGDRYEAALAQTQNEWEKV